MKIAGRKIRRGYTNMTNDFINKQAARHVLEETIKLDSDREREDFMRLYSDIIKALYSQGSDCACLFYEYIELMDREQSFFSPESAYEAGLHVRHTEFEPMFMQYISGIYLDPQNCLLLQKRDNLFHELCEILGDARGLMPEFNDLYRECNGIISRKIDRFFRLGFEQSQGQGAVGS